MAAKESVVQILFCLQPTPQMKNVPLPFFPVCLQLLYERGVSLRSSFLFLSFCSIILLFRTLFLMPKGHIPYPVPEKYTYGSVQTTLSTMHHYKNVYPLSLSPDCQWNAAILLPWQLKCVSDSSALFNRVKCCSRGRERAEEQRERKEIKEEDIEKYEMNETALAASSTLPLQDSLLPKREEGSAYVCVCMFELTQNYLLLVVIYSPSRWPKLHQGFFCSL